MNLTAIICVLLICATVFLRIDSIHITLTHRYIYPDAPNLTDKKAESTWEYEPVEVDNPEIPTPPLNRDELVQIINESLGVTSYGNDSTNA